MTEVIAGVFENHFEDKYKKESASVKAFEPDAIRGYQEAKILPSDEPEHALGLPYDDQEKLAKQRSLKLRHNVDNPMIRIKGKGDYEIVRPEENEEVRQEQIIRPLDRIPNDLMIDIPVKLVDTGKTVTERMNAREAYQQTNDLIGAYQRMMKCMNSSNTGDNSNGTK